MSSRCQEMECFCTYYIFCAPLWNKWNSNDILSFSLSWGFNKKSCSFLFYYFCKIIIEARGLEGFFQLGGSHKYDNSLSRLLFILLLCVSCFILVVRFHFFAPGSSLLGLSTVSQILNLSSSKASLASSTHKSHENKCGKLQSPPSLCI